MFGEDLESSNTPFSSTPWKNPRRLSWLGWKRSFVDVLPFYPEKWLKWSNLMSSKHHLKESFLENKMKHHCHVPHPPKKKKRPSSHEGFLGDLKVKSPFGWTFSKSRKVTQGEQIIPPPFFGGVCFFLKIKKARTWYRVINFRFPPFISFYLDLEGEQCFNGYGKELHRKTHSQMLKCMVYLPTFTPQKLPKCRYLNMPYPHLPVPYIFGTKLPGKSIYQVVRLDPWFQI